MQEKSTFIKLNRSILNWRWYKNANTMRVFIHLLLKANIKDHDFENTTVKRGQLITSVRQLSKELKISERAVRTTLEHLKTTHEVTIKTTAKYSIVTIKKYDEYQKSTHDMTNNRHSDDTLTTNYRQQSKNDKKEKNDKKDNNISFNYQSVIDLFNSICTSLPSVKKLTDKRRRQIKNAYKLLEGISFDDFFQMVESSDFLTGRSGAWEGCSFDWVMNSSNLIKIIEGNYVNKGIPKNTVTENPLDLLHHFTEPMNYEEEGYYYD